MSKPEIEPCMVCGWNYEPNGSFFCDECENERESESKKLLRGLIFSYGKKNIVK